MGFILLILFFFKTLLEEKMNFTLTYLILILSISIINAQINWQNGQPTGTKWAMACDFKGSDLTNKRIAASNCAQTCASTSGCTHFSSILPQLHPTKHQPHKARAKITQITSKTIIIDSVIINKKLT